MAMVVPMSKGQSQDGRQEQPLPSQTDLLMALAEMHKQGRFAPPKASSVKVQEE